MANDEKQNRFFSQLELAPLNYSEKEKWTTKVQIL